MINDEIRKQLKKQLQLLSNLSEKEELTIADRLAISAEIRAICRQVFECQNVRWAKSKGLVCWID